MCVCVCLRECVCMRVCVMCYVFEAVHEAQFAFVTSDKKERKFKAQDIGLFLKGHLV